MKTRLGPITDQWLNAFALASGDDNPLHTGPRAVVHGSLILALAERFVEEQIPGGQLVSLETRFVRPIRTGETIELGLGAKRAIEMDQGSGFQQRLTAVTETSGICMIGDIIVVPANPIPL